MFHSYFNKEQQILIAISILFVVVSLSFLIYKKNRQALFFLILAAITFKYFAISADNYINYWDESFHALVAKNLSINPLKPVLYKHPLLPYDYKYWCGNYIWLHKQPLFLWQSALSFKLFGVSEIAYRLPSLILSVLAVPLIYRLGELLSSSIVGYFSALFFIFSFYTNSLTSGYYMSAENDLVFMIYVLGSCWAYLEYKETGKGKYIILLSVFCGFALLTKWLVGLLVYSAWAANIAMEVKKNKQEAKKEGLLFLKSLTLVLFIVLPWYIYIFNAFPKEAIHEFNYNSKHFFEVVEGHAGGWEFHFEKMEEIYYPLSAKVIIPIIIIGLLLIKDKTKRISIALFVFLPFLFFTFARTKMPSFTYVIFPYMLLLVVIFAEFIFNTLFVTRLNKKILFLGTAAILSVLLFQFTSIERFQREHTDQNIWNGNRIERIHNKKEYFIVESQIDTDKSQTALFNVSFPYNIDMMFYTDIISYAHIPNEEQVNLLKEKNINIFVIDDATLPKKILEDVEIKKIKANLLSDFSY